MTRIILEAILVLVLILVLATALGCAAAYYDYNQYGGRCPDMLKTFFPGYCDGPNPTPPACWDAGQCQWIYWIEEP